jgi:hypothetical protein
MSIDRQVLSFFAKSFRRQVDAFSALSPGRSVVKLPNTLLRPIRAGRVALPRKTRFFLDELPKIGYLP